jgi:Mor family transcriptional regulator
MKLNLATTLTEILNIHLNEIKQKNVENLKKDHILKVTLKFS